MPTYELLPLLSAHARENCAQVDNLVAELGKIKQGNEARAAAGIAPFDAAPFRQALVLTRRMLKRISAAGRQPDDDRVTELVAELTPLMARFKQAIRRGLMSWTTYAARHNLPDDTQHVFDYLLSAQSTRE